MKKRSRLWRGLAVTVLLIVALSNTFVYLHVYAATHFLESAEPLVPWGEMSAAQKARTLVFGIQARRPENRQVPSDVGLPYVVERISLNEQEWLEAWHVQHPQPRGIVLMFAGYVGSKDFMLIPATSLFDMGYSSLLVDVRGAGGSSGNDTTLGLREAEDVAAAFKYARAQSPHLPIVLHGASMGGAAVLRAVAHEGVQPDAVIVEGTFDSLRSTIQHRFQDVSLPGSPFAEWLLFWGSVQLGYNGFAHNPVDYAAKVTVPTLVMSGAHDSWVLPSETEAIGARLAGPKQIVIVPEIGHHMPFAAYAHDLWREQVELLLLQL